MLFNSFAYLLFFFPGVALACYALRASFGIQAAQILLLAAALVFYGWSKPSNLFLLGGSILFNWLLAHSMTGLSKILRRRVLILGLVANVLFLCLFKYVNFFLAGFSKTSWPRPSVAETGLFRWGSAFLPCNKLCTS